MKFGVPFEGVFDLFLTLGANAQIESRDLTTFCGLSIQALNQIKSEYPEYFQPVAQVTALTKAGMDVAKGLAITKDPANVDYLKDVRPEPNRDYDQFTATLKTVKRRAETLDMMGDVHGKRILFLGDDDFTSTVLPQLSVPEKITVIDIDKRILSGIQKISDEKRLGIETVQHDMRNKLPTNLLGAYDVVFTDPPYTPKGLTLFLSRGIQALDFSNKSARIYFCYGSSDLAKEKFLEPHKIALDAGLFMRHVFDKFNRYHGAESIGSASSLFVTELTPRTKVLIKGNYNEPIYTNN